MERSKRLRNEAKGYAKFHGHELKRFKRGRSSYRITYHSMCKKCFAGVFVDTLPLPNCVDISGEAVAINCNN